MRALPAVADRQYVRCIICLKWNEDLGEEVKGDMVLLGTCIAWVDELVGLGAGRL